MIKRLIGIAVLLLLGFLLFMCLSGLGYALAITLMIMSWWQIVAGTILGSVLVVLYLLSDISKECK